jgi:hypothetical protein
MNRAFIGITEAIDVMVQQSERFNCSGGAETGKE